MEFLVEFQVDVPEGTPDFEVERRERAPRPPLPRIWLTRGISPGSGSPMSLHLHQRYGRQAANVTYETYSSDDAAPGTGDRAYR